MPGSLDCHCLNGFFNEVRIVHAAFAQFELTAQPRRIDRVHIRNDLDGANSILRALVDCVRNNKALLRGVVFADCGNDAHIGIAVFQIEATQQIAVRLYAVGIIDVGCLQEAEDVAFRRFDHVFQPARRIGLVADKLDILDAGLVALPDLEDEIDAIVRQFDNLRDRQRRRNGRCDDRFR